MGDDQGEPREPFENITTFLPGAAVGAALVGIIWALVAVVTGGSDPAAPAADLSRSDPLLGASRGAQSGPSILDRCDSKAISLAGPLEVAEPAMDQWELHIGAMNKLVVGAITLDQANAFWNQTRVGAHRRIDEFLAADKEARKQHPGCPAADKLPPTADRAALSCARKVDAERAALRVGRTAVHTWKVHVHHMEMLRDGMMSPARATELWLAMWQRGVHELKDYRAAEKLALRTGVCPAVTGGVGAPAPGDALSPTSTP
ncbi:MAG TPA: hypothetical protein VFT70_11910 [Nocardioides sp.]|nr:hypothetical protein [Nocardioides sp.]